MKYGRIILAAPLLLITLSIFAHVAEAQALRTFVASDGKDNNTCVSLDKPCLTISAALSKVQAGGEVIVLDSGNYQPLTINKAVDILAAPGAHPGIGVTTGVGVTVSAGPSDVVLLRGLRIISQGGSRGVHFLSGRALHIENCSISGFTPLPGDCCTDGILVNTASTLVVKDTTVRNNFNGIRIFTSQSALIERGRIESNTNGLWAEDAARVTISDSVVAGNGSGITSFVGTFGTPSGATEINVENCRVTGNIQGLQSTGRPGDNTTLWTLIRVSNTTVASNFQGLAVGTAGSARLSSRGNNTVEGNNIDGAFTDLFVAK